MRPSHKASGGLLGNRGEKADLKELTIEMGHSDIYINVAKRVQSQDGHVLFEAILSDQNGSRVIYVDVDDIAQCLKESFILGGTKPTSAEGEPA